MKTETRKFECFYLNDGSDARISLVQDILAEMSEGATRVVCGWVVTKLHKGEFEVGTIGNPDNVFCTETLSEGIASSTNWIFD